MFRLSVASILSVVVVVLIAGSTMVQTPGPNIVLLLSDDQSYPDLSIYGNADVRTPSLDELAREGQLFTRAYVTAPQCVQSRASIATGLWPLSTGVLRFSAPLPETTQTVFDTLRDNGYYVGAIGRGHHLDGSRVDDDGKGSKLDDSFSSRLDYVSVAHDASPEVLEEFLASRPSGKPFFLQIGFSDPHRPHDATDYEPDPETISVPPDLPDLPLIRRELSAYYGEVNRMDASVGAILKVFEREGLGGSTAFIFMGDNGAAVFRGKGTLYERGIHVPLVIRAPGGEGRGTVRDEPVSGIDLAPTILDFAGVSIPETLNGYSLLPEKADRIPEDRKVYAVRGSHGTGLAGNNTIAFDLGRAIVTGRYKLIYNAIPRYPYGQTDIPWKVEKALIDTVGGKALRSDYGLHYRGKRPMFELFDLVDDPFERRNLFDREEYDDVRKNLMTDLSEWMVDQNDFVPIPYYGLLKR